MKNFAIPAKVRKVSKLEKKSLSSRCTKLFEEGGELAAEILRFQSEKSAKGKTKDEILYDLHLEAVDCMLMAMDILAHTGASDKRIRKIMIGQMAKWEDKSR